MRQNPSFASHARRFLTAASLAVTVATIGCTTDRVPGAGEPQRYGPSASPTMPSSSSTPGTEQSRPVNPPMISSYTGAPNAVMPRHADLDALAVVAANQSFRGRYLGPADPGSAASYATNSQMANFQTGQFINPSDTANPQITVNSSISSQPTPVVASGGGGAGVFVATTGAVTPAASNAAISALTAGVTTTPTTAAATVSPTTAANTVATSATASNAANAPAAVINNFGGFLTPTMSSGATVSPTVAANPGVGNVGAGRTVTTITNNATTTQAVNSGVRTSALTTATGSSSRLVIARSANGTIRISNVSTDRAVSTTQKVTTPQTPGLRFH